KPGPIVSASPVQLTEPEATRWATTLNSPLLRCCRRRIGGRIHSGRDFVIRVSQSSYVESHSKEPNLIPEGEQRLRRSRRPSRAPARQRGNTSGFPLIPRSLVRSEARRGSGSRCSGSGRSGAAGG